MKIVGRLLLYLPIFFFKSPLIELKIKIKGLRDELDERMEEAKRTSVKIKQDLKAILAGLNDKRTAFNRSPSDKKLETSIRIQSGQYSTLMNSFGETMQKFNDIEVSYMDKCKRIIQRQLSITGVNKTNEEVQEMLDSRNPKIFTQEVRRVG
jgi:t-SNARE complex subunit (syntaxin)